MHIVFYGVRFDSIVVTNVLINISSPKLDNQIFETFKAGNGWICWWVNLNT